MKKDINQPKANQGKREPNDKSDIIKASYYVMERSKSITFDKAKRTTGLERLVNEKKDIPEAGRYKNTIPAYKKFVETKGRLATIYNYKFTRVTEIVMKEKMKIPGPGAYDIGPPPESAPKK